MPLSTFSIGAQSFIRLDGALDPDTTELVEVTRPGVDGRAYKQMGSHGNRTTLSAVVDVSSSATAAALIDSYGSMVGTVVTIVFDGQSRPNYLVHKAQVTSRKRVETATGGLGNGNYLVTSEWEVEYVGT